MQLAGGTWNLMGSPNRSAADNIFSGVACTSAAHCIAVGEFFTDAGRGRTLVEEWSGGVWTINASPNRGAADSMLSDVACVDAQHCTAVGRSSRYTNSGFVVKTVAETLESGAWTLEPTPNRNAAQNDLRGVACLTPPICVAVGTSNAIFTGPTLVVRSAESGRWRGGR
jgi:hypothetical protein